jgi:hypothetical protein
MSDEDIEGEVNENDLIIPLKYYWWILENSVIVSSDSIDMEFCGIIEYPCKTLEYSTERLYNYTSDEKMIEIKSEILYFSKRIFLSENIPTKIYKSPKTSESIIKCLESNVGINTSGKITIENLQFILPNSLSSSFFLLTNSLILINCSFSHNDDTDEYILLSSSFISLVKNDGDIILINSSFSCFSLKSGFGCIINVIINSGDIVRITNSTFINCSNSETKSQGGVIYCEIKEGGKLIIGEIDNNNNNNKDNNDDSDNDGDDDDENMNRIILENKFENCSTRSDEDGGGRGGAIALHMEDGCTSDSIHFIGIKIKFFLYIFLFLYEYVYYFYL